MVVRLLTHICITWPQWVNMLKQKKNFFYESLTMIRLKWSKFTLKLGKNLIMPRLLRWSTITILMAYCKTAVSPVGLQWRYHPQSCTKPLPYATSATAIFCYELLDIFFLPYPQSLLWTEVVLISIQKNCNNCICTVRLLYKKTA